MVLKMFAWSSQVPERKQIPVFRL